MRFQMIWNFKLQQLLRHMIYWREHWANRYQILSKLAQSLNHDRQKI
jgi:hypothetical protein